MPCNNLEFRRNQNKALKNKLKSRNSQREISGRTLNAQLISLVGENGAEMLISAFRSRKSISGPELTK